MKKLVFFVSSVICVMVIAVSGVHVSWAKPGKTIVTDKIILPSGPEQYIEVRHIVVKGSNEEIGKALADIARKDYDADLVKYTSPIYAKARLDYMKKNYPILKERMGGVARSYGLVLDKTDYDTSSLYYSRSAPQCSAIFFPADVSANGHSFYACNRDYYLASMSEVVGKKRQPGEKDMLSRMIVLEMYPDQGYSSIGIGALDILSMHIDSVNSKGLSITTLEDDTFGAEHILKDLSRQSGLHQYQAIQLIMDTCATLEEAKEVILNNKVTMSLIPAHFMIMDSTGRSFIYEKSSEDFSDRFIDGEGKPVVITNHSVYDYPTVEKFPKPNKDSYDTFNRYRVLEEYVKTHKGKYTEGDGTQALSLAYGRVDEASEGGHHDLPLRTLYTAVVDLDQRSIWARFYSRDGKRDPKTGLPELIFSKPFEFKLKKD